MASEYVDDPEDDSFNDAIEEDDAGQISDDSFNEEPTEEDDGAAAASSATDAGKRKSSGGEQRAQQSRLQVTGSKQEYVIQDESELRVAMQSLTRDVATVLHVPDHLASMLLRTHNWNKEKFVTSYFEDPERLLEKNGLQFMEHDGVNGACSVTTTKDERDISQASSSLSQSRLPSAADLDRSRTAPPNNSLSYEPSTSSSSSSSSSSTSAAASAAASSTAATPSFNCTVCYDDYAVSDTVALGCGDKHRFCRGCWGNYLTTAVNDGKQCIVTHCAGFKCPVLVPDKTFFNLTAPDVFARHQTYLVRSFVEDSRLMRWCPGQRCNLAVRVFNSALLAVKCRCGHSFCFQCGEDNHAPVDCARLQAWNEKCKNESETAHWIMANTKKCPNAHCGVRIEKNQGCNHMTCRGCKFEWCWVCHQDWKLHGNHTGGYYKCNKWDPKAASAAKDGATGGAAGSSAEQAKEQLNRYLHYYQRFHNHDASRRFAAKQKATTDARMQSLHAKSGGDAAWIDFQFLAAATDQVLECRNVLKYTYVLAYYLDDGPEKTLFEYLQQQLEQSTEHLSELSELPPLDKLDRAQIVNYTRITGQFMTNLLEGVQNGLTPH